MRGEFFALETGEYWTAIECSDFNLFARFLNGEDIRPVLEDRQGFNLLRVWTLYDVDGIGRLVPGEHADFYTNLTLFLHLCGDYGLYVEVTCFTGTSRLMPSGAAQQAHLDAVCQAVRDYGGGALIEVGNEYDQGDNWWTLDLSYPNDLLLSGGSCGSELWPSTKGLPTLQYSAFHTNGAFQWPRKNGHNAMEIADATRRPALTNESTRCPDNASDPQMYFDAAAGAALLCAGSCFHSASGKLSQVFDAAERACADAHIAGAESVRLEYQDGGYNHLPELEGTDYLRVYSRRNAPGDEEIVKIHNF